VIFPILFLILPLQAFAFHVPDHVAITARAVNELSACGLLSPQWTTDVTSAVESADESEDYNLFRKWSYYSHYYNPYHALDQFRADSSASVTEAAATIKASPLDAYAVNQGIGRLIHHVQDASTPAHAVPVAHAFSDGFEVFDIAAYFAEPLSPTACPLIQASTDPMETLRTNAIATLDSLKAPLTLIANHDGAEIQNTWDTLYWVPGTGNSFGEYGIVGNAFGTSAVVFNDDTGAHVSQNKYFAFKRARAEAAVRATEAVILWANKLRNF
jgi:hypothetical protein